MKKLKYLLAALAATFMTVIPLTACNSSKSNEERDGQNLVQDDQSEAMQPTAPDAPSLEENEQPDGNEHNIPDNVENIPDSVDAPPDSNDKLPETVTYFTVTADSVNIRSGAGTGYSVRGQAEKSTLYRFTENSDGWYKTGYRNKDGYISGKYCTLINMPSSDNELIEAVIEEGCKLLGTPYVYGAVRLHDGRGNFYKSFTTDEFDCSSLMQYIFYKGAGKLLDVNTRTQVYHGTTVDRSQLKRGDLMFFTNAQRKNNKGVERIGHVALYLGDNYILHTASDYAKIEQISSTRWSYFIQGQRIL